MIIRSLQTGSVKRLGYFYVTVEVEVDLDVKGEIEVEAGIYIKLIRD